MNSQPRFHALDAMRGAMMMLGVIIHSATAYSTLPDVWWIKDPVTGKGMDVLIVFLHTFRLPAFFVMAGFFAALLVERRGWTAMLENRLMRLVLPLLLGMVFLYPFMKLTSVFHWCAKRGADPLAATLDWLARGRYTATLEPAHFWFLETLVWVTLIAVASQRWLRHLESGWFLRLMRSRWGMLIMSAATLGTLALTPAGILDTPKGFSPHWHVVLSYFVFYAYGWGLYSHRDQLVSMERYGWKEMTVALVLLAPAIVGLEAQLARRDVRQWGPLLLTAAATALSAWLMIYGLTGFFLRRFRAPDPFVRYLSDSAYWVYMAHPVVLLAIQVPMLGLAWNEWVKFTIGIAFAVPVLLMTYDLFVRQTWIGVVLNGRRCPRWRKKTQPARESLAAAAEA